MPIQISAELSHICPLQEIAKHAAVLDKTAFHRVWIPDTLVSSWEAWMVAGLIAKITRRIQIGVGVMNPYTRHPVIAAQMAASLQQISGGRLALSIGKGIAGFLKKAGISQHQHAADEFIFALKNLIAGEKIDLAGKVFRLEGMRLRVVPHEKKIPIYMAATSADSWRSAVEIADGIAAFWSPETAELRRQFMSERRLPVYALVPFSLTLGNFFAQRIRSTSELTDCIFRMEDAGIDEAVVAYGERRDLEAVADIAEGDFKNR